MEINNTKTIKKHQRQYYLREFDRELYQVTRNYYEED